MSPQPPETPSHVRILVVDDDPTMVALFSGALRKASFELATAIDGISALEAFSKARPDLVLLDLQMPKMGGLEVLEKIRRIASPIETPVLVCTSIGEEDSIERALELGANDYLVKPVSARSVLARVNLHLRLQQLSKMLAERESLDAITAMVVTYNHELNNPLTVVHSCLEVLTKRSDLPGEAVALLDKINRATQRTITIVRHIREITREKLVKVPYVGSTKMLSLESDAKLARKKNDQ